MFRERIHSEKTNSNQRRNPIRRRVAAATLATASLTGCLGNEAGTSAQDTMPASPATTWQVEVPTISEDGTTTIPASVAGDIAAPVELGADAVNQFMGDISTSYEQSGAVLEYQAFVPEAREPDVIWHDMLEVDEDSPEYERLSDEYNETFAVEQDVEVSNALLEAADANYRFSVRTRSGLKFNFYQPVEETDPLSVDPRAFDVLVDLTLLLASNQVGSQAEGVARDLYAAGQRGGLTGIVNLLVSTTPGTCVELQDVIPPVSAVVEDATGKEQVVTYSCDVVGTTQRAQGRRNSIQSIVIAGSGMEYPQQTYEGEYSGRLGVNASQTVTLAHELGHSFLGMTNKGLYIDDPEKEHTDFVNGIEEDIFALFCEIAQEETEPSVEPIPGVKEAVPFTDPD